MASKLVFSLVVLGVLCCCLSLNFSEDWTIAPRYTPSSGSRFFVLNDWQGTLSAGGAGDTPAFPAARISNVMLKTMGILRDGGSWSGVSMGSLFNRPLATALFLIDGVSSDSTLESLSTTSFKVDQTGLTGCTCGDTKIMFSGDNVARHMSKLFDQNSHTRSVSANTMAAQAASANGAYTDTDQLDAVVKDVQNGDVSLAEYGLEAATSKLDTTNEVDARFIAELVLIKKAIEQLDGYASDGAPDVFVFTISTLEHMEERYGKGSSKMGVAAGLAKQVIQESSDVLVKVYNGQVLVQALVLEWDRPALDTSAPEIENAFHLLRPFLAQEDRDSFLSTLPHVSLREQHQHDTYLCQSLKRVVRGSSFYAHCPEPEVLEQNSRVLREAKSESRVKRSVQEESYDVEQNTTVVTLGNVTVYFLAESRGDNFSAVFLIFLFVTLTLGIALYAINWTLWHMDPGRDSVLYRLVADPTIRT